MNKNVKMLLVTGVVFTVLPLIVGTAVTVLSMISSFHDLGQKGIADPQQLSDHIGLSLVATFIGVSFSAVGVLILVVAGVIYLIAGPARKAAPT